MTDQTLAPAATAVFGTACILVLSLPAIKSVLDGARLLKGYRLTSRQYEDEDGAATEASVKAYSDLGPRIVVLFSSITGLGVSIALRVLTGNSLVTPWTSIVDWSGVTSWTLVCLQALCLPLKHHYLLRYRLSVYGLVSTLLLAGIIGWKDAYPALGHLVAPQTHRMVHGILSLVQVAAALIAVCAFGSFPRRPDVFYNDHLVDQQHTVSLVRRISYSYNMRVFDTAKTRQMSIADLHALDHSIRSRDLNARFLVKCGDGSLFRQLLSVHLSEVAMQWIFTVAGSVLSLFPQLVLYKFLQAIEDREEPETTDPYVFVWAFALLFSQAVGIGFQTWSSWFTATRLIAPASSLLQSLIFSKAMRQYDTAIANQGDDADNTRDERSAEKMKEKLVRQSVINHMQMDTSRVTMFFMFNSHIPSAFTNFFLAGSFLVRLMGWRSVLAGILAAGLMAPFTAWFGRSYSKLTISLMISRDSKANVLTEVLQGMRQIKYSGLERHWEKKMLARREEELEKYRTVSLWGCLLIFLVNLGPILLGCVTFSVYAWQNGTHIKASVIFTSLDLLNRVSSSMSALPMLQMLLLEAWTSCKRLDKYLSQADREPVAEPGARICFEKATVAWPKAEDGDSAQTPAARPEERSMLRDITLEIPTGKLSVVTGKTGSGKSLLLAAVLGEVKLVSGSIHTPQPSGDTHSATDLDLSREWIIPSSMAFVSQTPWIESGTLKENITFGLPFDDSRYKKVLYACALEKDIEHLADGEQTQVGAKGVTLSGGQRWRLALARALYSRAATIILDDVLSAVDSHVGKTIVEEGLTGELARGRTRVLATHHAELVLPHAHYLIELRDGRLESAQAIDQSTSLLGGRACSDRDTGSPAPPGTNGNANASKIDREASHQYVAGEQRPDARLSLDESHEAGRVKWRVYMAYFRASGPFIWTVGVGMLIVTRVVGVTETWALKELTETASLEATSTSIPPGKESQLYRLKNLNTPTSDSSRQIIFWLGLYVLLHIVGGVLRAGNMVASLTVSLKTSRVLFQRMTHAVLRAPLRWMDQVPSGRILNRFTSDISQIDQRVARETLDLITSALALAVITGTSLFVTPWITFFGIILVFFYINVASKYIVAAREVNRINATSNSPVYDQFSSVLSGLSTIRAFGRTEYYMDRMYNLIDNSTKARLASIQLSQWLSFRLGMLGVLFVTVVAYAVAVGGASAALAGFSLSFAFQYSAVLDGLLQTLTSWELGFNAVDRVVEYAEIDTEPQGGADAPAAWPSDGRIEIENLTVSYGEGLPDVLTDLNLSIKAAERVGIVGRTGAGKSTLAAILFRLMEPKKGTIRIDNIDISTLKIDQLRSRLAIIPQDPFLFSGTLRSNLDMEGHYDDYDLHQALQRVHLVIDDEIDQNASLTQQTAETSSASSEPSAAAPANIFTNLSTPITSGGANLSQGQRQLVCLARALLRRPKLIVLDEATSAVDRATDAAIQVSLRREFAGCTVLVVAHRLSTVADFDRLLVLESGRVAEMGTPEELLRRGMEREKQGRGTETRVGGKPSEHDGTGAFWELVKNSVERAKLTEMIQGKAREVRDE